MTIHKIFRFVAFLSIKILRFVAFLSIKILRFVAFFIALFAVGGIYQAIVNKKQKAEIPEGYATIV
jgi:hypothetical protein